MDDQRSKRNAVRRLFGWLGVCATNLIGCMLMAFLKELGLSLAAFISLILLVLFVAVVLCLLFVQLLREPVA